MDNFSRHVCMRLQSNGKCVIMPCLKPQHCPKKFIHLNFNSNTFVHVTNIFENENIYRWSTISHLSESVVNFNYISVILITYSFIALFFKWTVISSWIIFHQWINIHIIFFCFFFFCSYFSLVFRNFLFIYFCHIFFVRTHTACLSLLLLCFLITTTKIRTIFHQAFFLLYLKCVNWRAKKNL